MYLYIFIFIIVVILYIKHISIKEYFQGDKKITHINNVKAGPNWNYKNKTLTYNPYFKENKSLKSMIGEMCHDALNDELKKAPTLISFKSLNELNRVLKNLYVKLPSFIK